MTVTPEMIAAAWATWHSRHGGKLGPGPGFVEAINAALAARAQSGDTPAPRGWPDPLESPQAEAIRNGKIDDVDIVALFDAMEREIRVHRGTFCAEAGLTHTTPPQTQVTVPASMIEDGSPLVTDLIREFERARRQWDEFQKTGVSTAAIGSYDLCFSAVLKKHFAPSPETNMGGGDELSLTKTGLKIAMIKIAAYEARIAELEAAALPPQTKMTVADFATRLFDLHGFMLLETYRGKHAVTVTFPDLQEAQQFHNALIELSQHRVTPRTLEGKTDA